MAPPRPHFLDQVLPGTDHQAFEESSRQVPELASGESDTKIPSQFLPRTVVQFAWDSTSLGAFKKCPRYYQLKILEGWSRSEDSIHLRWGQELHSALEDYQRSIALEIKHDDAVHDTIRALLERIEDWDPMPQTKSEEVKTKAALLRTVVWYLEHYRDDSAETFVLDNGKPAVELSFNFELQYGPGQDEEWAQGHKEVRPYLLCGHLDRIVRYSGDLYVMDHKTTSTTPGPFYWQQWEPNNQMSLYTLASQVILGSPIRGVILDVLQIGPDFSRFTRGFTYRTPDQLEEWLDGTKRWLQSAENCATESFWPMNDTACDKFGGCEFREICSRSPQVRERFLQSNFERKEPWNPLKPR